MKKVISFANGSAKRQAVFKDILGGSLQGLCKTRWVERHDGHLQFKGDSLVKVCEVLKEIMAWDDNTASTDA